MATHSSVLSWRTPGTGDPGGLPSMGSHRFGHNWSNVAVADETYDCVDHKKLWKSLKEMGLCGRGRRWDDLGEWHWNIYNIICETSRQSKFEAWYWMLGAGAPGLPRGMAWEGGGFRMGYTCIPVADSFWYMAKLIQYCKLKKKKKMGIADHLTCVLRNLYAGQEATVRTEHGTLDWFQIGKGVRQDYILSLWLFNLYAEYIMKNTGLDEA